MPRGKKRELTEEEKFQREKERQLNVIENEMDHLNKPTYKFNVGDKVKFGALKKSTVKEILHDGKIYVLDCIAVNENYGRPYEQRECKVVAWNDVRPLNFGNTNFTKNDDVALRFNGTDVKSLISKYYHFGINMNPDYQRDYVWSSADEENLLDSIFNNIDIGKFVLVYLEDNEWIKTGFGYEILDGKQRLNTLIKFYENRIPYKGSYYNDLSAKDRRTFNSAKISIAEVEYMNKQNILRYFIMLNTAGKVMDKNQIDKVREMMSKQ